MRLSSKVSGDVVVAYLAVNNVVGFKVSFQRFLGSVTVTLTLFLCSLCLL